MYKVLAAIHTDMNDGWVWLTAAVFVPRSIIKITNKANDRSVYCECLAIDDNFINEYNQSLRVNIDRNENTIVMNGWYMKRLGAISTKESHDLNIVSANSLWGKFRACWRHLAVTTNDLIC